MNFVTPGSGTAGAEAAGSGAVGSTVRTQWPETVFLLGTGQTAKQVPRN